ncbi:MAG TPA: PAS domain S-box protein [Steroidobacteraceae bacterium]|nr:PAS domain S-box protein [Steroidobacteraceae bacterium]
MPPLPTDELQIIEGVVAEVVSRPGIVQFLVGNQWYGLMTSRSSKPLCVGDVVRVLARDAPNQPILDVLVLQRAEEEKIEYTGPGVSLALTILAAVVLAMALDEQIWWLLLPAGALALLQVKFSMQKDRVLRRFRSLQRHTLADLESRGTPLVGDVPLTMPQPSLTSSALVSLPAQILEFTHDAIIIWELDGAGIVYWNRAAEQLYGWSREEAYGRVTHELLKTRLTGTVGELESQLARYGVWVGDLRHTRRDGQIVEVEARLSLMSQEHRPWLVLEVNRDVTDRNRAEAARAETKKQLERVRRQP